MFFIITMIKIKIVMTEGLTRQFLVCISVTKTGRFFFDKTEMWLNMFIARVSICCC